MSGPKPRSGVLAIERYVGGRAKAPGGQRTIKLSANETPLGPSPRAIEACRAAGVVLGVGTDKRFFPSLHELARLVRQPLGLVREGHVVPHADRLHVLHADVELAERAVGQVALRVAGIARCAQRRYRQEVVRRRRRRLVVQAFHRRDAAVGEVRQEHESERRPVDAERRASFGR